MELQERYRFHPTDSELLTFLLRFLAGKDLRDDGYITERDVYKQEPWVTYGYGRHCGGEDDGDTSIYRYFITPRHKSLQGLPIKNKKKDRFCRIVGEKLGTWKQQDEGKDVITSSYGNQSKSLIIGRKKSICYETTRCCPDDGKWLMKEYEFCETTLRKFGKSNLQDYVICAIKKKSKKDSSNSRNVTTIMDTEVKSGVNSVELSMDQEYKLDKNQPQHQPAQLQEGCTFGVNGDHIAYLELETKGKSFFELLSGGADYCIRNNHVRIQEAPGEENGHLELYTFSQIQEPAIPDYFAIANSELNMPDFFDTLAEYVGVTVESNEPRMQTQEAAGEVNGLLGLTAPSSQIQESAVPKNNVPETLDMGETLLETNQTQHQPAPQGESETFCETEESSFVVSDLVKAMLDHATMEERSAALRANQITLMFDQQSWQSKTHLQDMLL